MDFLMDSARRKHRLRIVVPAFPAFNIYSRSANRTTALGPVCVATAVQEMAGWDAEVIDENNLGRYGPRVAGGGADHESLQRAGKRIMGRFYHFRYALLVVASILSFPTLIFFPPSSWGGREQMVSTVADPAGSSGRLAHDTKVDIGFRKRGFPAEAAEGPEPVEGSAAAGDLTGLVPSPI